MDSAKLNDWMQVIGIFALVASLIFVGLQMKQDHEIARAAQFQQRVEVALVLWDGYAESEYDVLRLGNRLLQNPDWDGILGDAATPATYGDAYISARKTFVVLENHHYQYSLGFYDDETWSMFREQTRLYLANDKFARTLIRENKGILRPSFLKLCEQMIREVELDDS
jgi:hypothetical protein